MERFVTHVGVAAPLARSNVNTDDIIPARFLKTVRRTGFAEALFANWRYREDDTTPDPDFVLNQPRYAGASVLVTGANFGCGSSREHAPWALREYGFRCIVAPSFADIFYNNCFNSSILPVVLGAAAVDAFLEVLATREQCEVHIDLPAQTVTMPDGRAFRFEVDAFKKAALLEGLDSIDWTRSHLDQILAHEHRLRREEPWLFADARAEQNSRAHRSSGAPTR